MPANSGTQTITSTAPNPRGHSGSSFAGDVLQLASGTASSQLIGILAAPLIARMFAPAAFGVLAIFSAFAGAISVISCLRYEVAICLPEHDEEAANLSALSFCLVTATTGAAVLLVLLFGDGVLRLTHASELAGYLWLLPLNVFVSGTWTILNFWNQRKRKFGRLTVMQIVSRVALVASQIVAGLAGYVRGSTLIATTIFGTLVTSALLGWRTLRDDRRLFISAVSWEKIDQVRRRYSMFPRFGLAATLLNSASFQLPVIFLSAFFNTVVVGNYSFGWRVMRVPGILIGTNVNRAFFPRAAEAKHQGTLGQSVETALQYLIILSFFPCFLLTLTGNSLFAFVFGPKWQEAGVYTQILSIWLFFWFVSSPLNTVFAVLEEQALELRFQVANLATRLIALVIGGVAGNPRLAIGLFTLFGVAVYGSYCLAVIRKSGASSSGIVSVLLSRAAQFVPAAAVIVVLKAVSAPPVVIVVATAITLAAYYGNLVRTDSIARRALKRFVCGPRSVASD
jgi:lipopolysaccharide exporter